MVSYKRKMLFLDVYQWGTTDIQSCPIKLPPLFRAPAVLVVLVWLIRTLMPDWCHLYAITTKILSIHFNYLFLFLLLLISLETTTPHVRRCPFIFAVLYTQVPTVPPPNRWPGCINDLPLYDTLYIINLQCTHSL